MERKRRFANNYEQARNSKNSLDSILRIADRAIYYFRLDRRFSRRKLSDEEESVFGTRQDIAEAGQKGGSPSPRDSDGEGGIR